MNAIFFTEMRESTWYPARSGVCCAPMGHCKGKDNVKKRVAKQKKNDRLALAKVKATAAK